MKTFRAFTLILSLSFLFGCSKAQEVDCEGPDFDVSNWALLEEGYFNVNIPPDFVFDHHGGFDSHTGVWKNPSNSGETFSYDAGAMSGFSLGTISSVSKCIHPVYPFVEIVSGFREKSEYFEEGWVVSALWDPNLDNWSDSRFHLIYTSENEAGVAKGIAVILTTIPHFPPQKWPGKITWSFADSTISQ